MFLGYYDPVHQHRIRSNCIAVKKVFKVQEAMLSVSSEQDITSYRINIERAY